MLLEIWLASYAVLVVAGYLARSAFLASMFCTAAVFISGAPALILSWGLIDRLFRPPCWQQHFCSSPADDAIRALVLILLFWSLTLVGVLVALRRLRR